jgi:competence protein ComEC
MALGFLLALSQLLWLPQLNLIWVLPLLLTATVTLYLCKPYPTALSFILAFCLAGCYGLFIGLSAKYHQLQVIPESSVTVVAKVTNLPVFSTDKVKFSAKVISNSADLHIKKILINWYANQQTIKPGQQWRFELKLRPIHGFSNPGTFDYSKWLFRHGYDATASVKSAELLKDQASDLNSIIHQSRQSIAQIIDQQLSTARAKALIRALTIGDKSQISLADSQLFQDTGTAHLIAISGLHIGLIAFLGVLLARMVFFIFANEKFNRAKIESIFAISFALIYALMAGLSVSTLRALIMVVVFSIAHINKQSLTQWQSWSIALLLVLIIDPFSVLDIGFWFSFTAVAVLIFAFNGRIQQKTKIQTFIKAQWLILLGLYPLMAMVFQRFNILTPIVNFIVLPLASLLLIPSIFVAFFVYLFSVKTAHYLFVVVEKLTQILFVVLDYMQQFKFLTISLNPLGKLGIFIMLLSALIMLLPAFFRRRILLIFLLIPLFFYKKPVLEAQAYNAYVLDVGQGLAVVIKTAKHSLIYDTGAKYDSGFSMASAVVIPFLQKKSINNPDRLILSHADNDHAGGFQELLSAYPDIEVFDVKGKFKGCKFPISWQWDGVDFSILSPFELLPYLGNNSSCVLKISSNNGSLLLTGDIEEPVEYRLTHQFEAQLKSDVLLVPHHGSRTSSSNDFINKVSAKIVLNSSGYDNQFNHPHPQIKQAYLQHNSQFYDTSNKGMISVKFQQSGIEVNQYNSDNPHFWHVL